MEAQQQLKESRRRVHSMEDKLLDLLRGLEVARAKTKKVEEALAEEVRAALEKSKRIIS